MIRFRCWYCNRAYLVADARIGERLVCPCDWRIRVPKVNDSSSRHRSALDWLIEWVVYGGGGGLLGFLLALLLLSRVPFLGRVANRSLLFGCTLVGLLAGGLGGEAGVNWLGRIIRDWEKKRGGWRRTHPPWRARSNVWASLPGSALGRLTARPIVVGARDCYAGLGPDSCLGVTAKEFGRPGAA